MAKPDAGQLYYRVGLEKRTTQNPDSPADYGNTEDVFTEQFETRAAYVHIRGSEDVLASRLTGVHVQVIRIRTSTNARLVTTDWRVVDKRNGDIFNIRDVTQETDRQFIDLLCQKGTAA